MRAIDACMAGVLASAVAGCAIPEGRFVCATRDDCPTDWFCRGDGLCYSTPDEGGVDAGLDASVDGGPRDAGGDARADAATDARSADDVFERDVAVDDDAFVDDAFTPIDAFVDDDAFSPIDAFVGTDAPMTDPIDAFVQDAPSIDAPSIDARVFDVPPPIDGGVDAPVDVGVDAPVDAFVPTCVVDPDGNGYCEDTLAAGYATCSLRPGGGVRCWGFNGPWRSLGDGVATHTACPDTRDCSPSPVFVASVGSGTVTGLTGGEETYCVRFGSTVRCWGYNTFVPPDAGFSGPTGISISSGTTHVFSLRAPAVRVSGGARELSAGAWDVQGTGVWGTGTTPPMNSRQSMMTVSGLTGIATADAGWYHVCALNGAGGISCWGRGNSGALGTMATASTATPTAVSVSILRDPVQLALGSDFTCVLIDTGAVQCWGRSATGALGNGATSGSSLVSVSVMGLTDAVEIDAGFEFACARRSSGRVSCWGSDADGQLGDSATHSACGSGARCSGTPVDVVGITDAVDIVAGNNHACALHATGAVSCWGDNSLGQLGDGSFTDRATPVSVSGL